MGLGKAGCDKVRYGWFGEAGEVIIMEWKREVAMLISNDNLPLITVFGSGARVDFPIEYAWELYQKQQGKCALSKIPIVFGLANHRTSCTTASLDRIDSTIGYIKDNVQWVHKSINIMKCDLSSDIFIGFCHSVSDKHINKVSIKELSCNHFTKRKYKRRTK